MLDIAKLYITDIKYKKLKSTPLLRPYNSWNLYLISNTYTIFSVVLYSM